MTLFISAFIIASQMVYQAHSSILYRRADPQGAMQTRTYEGHPEAHLGITKRIQDSSGLPKKKHYRRWRELYQSYRQTRKAKKIANKRLKGPKDVNHDLDYLIPRMKLAKEKCSAYVALAASLTPEDYSHIHLPSWKNEYKETHAAEENEAERTLRQNRIHEIAALTGYHSDLFDPETFQDQLEFLQYQDGLCNEVPRRIRTARLEFQAVIYKDVKAAADVAEIFRGIYMNLRQKCLDQQEKGEASSSRTEEELANRLKGVPLREVDIGVQQDDDFDG